ncbi:hypothetical protein [Runella sp.]|jgi:hypothetical protein|uniref:hypothetical protein n=1 Tax=Runella sp. TaxID=1960881 RepID=UPI00260BC6E7|nr:hypothetical protein [Runella sp.]
MGLNQTIVSWVKSKVGTNVTGKISGASECWDLAEEALRENRAKTSNDVMGKSFKPPYKWGTAINSFGQLQAGDIVQFKLYKYTESNGAYQERGNSSWPYHTAIIGAVVGGDNDELEVYEQNIPQGGTVQSCTLYFKSKNTITVKGSFAKNWWFYRPIATP